MCVCVGLRATLECNCEEDQGTVGQGLSDSQNVKLALLCILQSKPKPKQFIWLTACIGKYIKCTPHKSLCENKVNLEYASGTLFFILRVSSSLLTTPPLEGSMCVCVWGVCVGVCVCVCI